MKIKINQKIKWKHLVGKTAKIGMSISQDKDIFVGQIVKTRNIQGEYFIELKLDENNNIWINTKYIVYIFGFKN